MAKNLSQLSKQEKLQFIKDGCWKLFSQTGDIKYYARYRGADQLIKENSNKNTYEGHDLSM